MDENTPLCPACGTSGSKTNIATLDSLDPYLSAQSKQTLLQLLTLSERPDIAPSSSEEGTPEHVVEMVVTYLAEQFQQERTLADATQEVIQGLYLEEVLNHIYNNFKTIIPYDRIGVALLEQNGAVLRARWARSETGVEPQIRVGFHAKMAGSSLEQILLTGKPRIINDLEEYFQDHPDSVSTDLALREGIRSNYTAPIIGRGAPVGFLFFSSVHPNTYSDAHSKTFGRVADVVSIAVEKAILYENLSKINLELSNAQKLLKYQATHDPMTGLLNHGAMRSELETRNISRRLNPNSGSGIGVLLLDVDHFKKVNDTYGHIVGDQTLKAVAATLSSTVRASDWVGRYGGEEFLVIADVATDEEAHLLAERLRRAVERTPMYTDAGNIDITVSIGVAVASRTHAPASANSLIHAADQALYQAKESGRNAVVAAP